MRLLIVLFSNQKNKSTTKSWDITEFCCWLKCYIVYNMTRTIHKKYISIFIKNLDLIELYFPPLTLVLLIENPLQFVQGMLILFSYIFVQVLLQLWVVHMSKNSVTENSLLTLNKRTVNGFIFSRLESFDPSIAIEK